MPTVAITLTYRRKLHTTPTVDQKRLTSLNWRYPINIGFHLDKKLHMFGYKEEKKQKL